MKQFYLIVSVMGALVSLQANAGYFEPDMDYSEFCAKAKFVNAETLICTGTPGVNALVNSRVGRQTDNTPKEVWQNFVGAYELSILPDADTNQIYRFVRELLNPQGRVIGYMLIAGYSNSETEDKLQLNTVYNLNGQLAAAYIKKHN